MSWRGKIRCEIERLRVLCQKWHHDHSKIYRFYDVRDASLQSLLKMTCVPSILHTSNFEQTGNIIIFFWWNLCVPKPCAPPNWTYTNRAQPGSLGFHCQAELLKSAGALPPKGGKKKKGRSLEPIEIYPEWVDGDCWFVCLFGKFFLVHFIYA